MQRLHWAEQTRLVQSVWRSCAIVSHNHSAGSWTSFIIGSQPSVHQRLELPCLPCRQIQNASRPDYEIGHHCCRHWSYQLQNRPFPASSSEGQSASTTAGSATGHKRWKRHRSIFLVRGKLLHSRRRDFDPLWVLSSLRSWRRVARSLRGKRLLHCWLIFSGFILTHLSEQVHAVFFMSFNNGKGSFEFGSFRHFEVKLYYIILFETRRLLKSSFFCFTLMH